MPVSPQPTGGRRGSSISSKQSRKTRETLWHTQDWRIATSISEESWVTCPRVRFFQRQKQRRPRHWKLMTHLLKRTRPLDRSKGFTNGIGRGLNENSSEPSRSTPTV